MEKLAEDSGSRRSMLMVRQFIVAMTATGLGVGIRANKVVLKCFCGVRDSVDAASCGSGNIPAVQKVLSSFEHHPCGNHSMMNYWKYELPIPIHQLSLH